MERVAAKEVPRRHFPITVEMYHIMAEKGAFHPEDRVELIEGEIFDMSPIGSLHARCVNFLTHYLNVLLNGKFIVNIQNPIILDDKSEPQPDISILKYRDDFYKDATPQASDVVLVIEVADTSVSFDRNRKLRRYAAAGIPEAWLIDLESEHVEVHVQPSGDTYELVKIYQRGKNVVSETIPSINLSADKILG